jgi:hypothetical protein
MREQRRLMRQETTIEGALLANLQICCSSKWRKNNGKKNYGDLEGDNTDSSMKIGLSTMSSLWEKKR